MPARPIASGNPPLTLPRFDAKFIEEHQLVERYLENKLPVKGARDLENWCRANPQYLADLHLAERAGASLKLLEASGRAVDLREPRPPWWKTPYVPIGLAVIALASLVGLWASSGRYSKLRTETEDLRTLLRQGPLVQPATSTDLRLTPDRAQGIGRAKIPVDAGAPRLVDLHIDMNHVKASQFRLVVDKQGQGRALILNNLVKDSNGELRLTFNTTGLSKGEYDVRIESYPVRGSAPPSADGWVALEVH